MMKPIDPEEQQARIWTLQRRSHARRSPLLERGKLCLHPQTCEVTYDGNPVSVSVEEYKLLELFLSHPDQIFSQSKLIEKLWAMDTTPTENAVRGHIKELRKKLKQAGAGEIIETVYKLGYRLQREDGKDSKDQGDQENMGLSAATPVPLSLEETWEECRESYSDRLSIIERAVTDLQAGILTTQLQEAEREAHTLIGSLGSFGLEEASYLARQIQQMLKWEEHLRLADVGKLSQLVRLLRRAIEQTREPEKPSSFSFPPVFSPCSALSRFTLLIVDDDVVLARQLATEAIAWGIQAEIATDLNQAREWFLSQSPDVMLLDLNFSNEAENGLDFLAEMYLNHPDLPILVFTASEAFLDRVEAARLGSKGFLQKPVAPHQVLTAIARVLQQPTQTSAKLLIVDDDRDMLNLLGQMLEPHGYHVTLLSQIHQFWQTLEQTNPDLLILDVELSDDQPLGPEKKLAKLSGFDLCQVIRNDPHWSNLSILFLSAHTELKTIQRAFEVGADDFLSKPITAAELLPRINHRLKQRNLQRLVENDQLTGLTNRYKGLQSLTRLLRLAQREQQPLSLAMLDLDQFKCINDQHGHAMGDRVLSFFAKLLQQSFRLEDVVARWGGDEFIVVMYGSSRQDGVKRVRGVLQRFRQEIFVGQNGSFQVTFSAGVAEFLEGGDDLQTLCCMADTALYQAKAQGRNCVTAARAQEKKRQRQDGRDDRDKTQDQPIAE